VHLDRFGVPSYHRANHESSTPQLSQPEDRIRVLAELSVRRGCGFAALAICTIMFGLFATPLIAVRTGAVLTTLTAAVLFYKGQQALGRNYRHTELWIMLDRNHGLPESYAGRIINTVLRDVYLRHADGAALIALVLWSLVVVGGLLF
jgi:hypothetical protein